MHYTTIATTAKEVEEREYCIKKRREITKKNSFRK